MSEKSNKPMLILENINKKFPGVNAVDNVSISFFQGEIHAILGHNGAGKSTLLKIISGAHRKDSGKMILNGKEISLTSPSDGLKNGICMVYQEVDLIPHLTGAENIFLGQKRFVNKLGLIDAQKRLAAAKMIMKKLHVDIDLTVPVSTLSVSKQQLIAIAKSLSHDAKVMIFDEPTAALTEAEAENLFSIMHTLAEDGLAIIWITHRLNEVFKISDKVSLMKEGKLISTNKIEELNMADVVFVMTGEKEEEIKSVRKWIPCNGPIKLSVNHLTLPGVYEDISFDLRAGEVLGITGLLGCGATEIAKTLFAVLKQSSGSISVNGKIVERFSPEKAVDLGIAYLPEDRKRSGLNLIASVKENISLPVIKRFSKFGFIDSKDELSAVIKMIQRLSIKVSDPLQLAGTLSGGNQQKIVLAKWLLRDAQIFIMCEPTRGIDIGVKREIHKIIRDLASKGMAVIVVSSEVEEIMDVSDRMLLLYEGKQIDIIKTGEQDFNTIMNTIYGVAK